MFRINFLVLLFMHVLGDYYFQNDRLAKKKTMSIVSVARHCIIYAAACMILTIAIYSKSIIIGVVALIISHVIIDFVKYFLVKYLTRKGKYTAADERTIYIVDQGFHLISIAIIAYVFSVNNNVITVVPYIQSVFEVLNLSVEKAFMWCLVLLLIWKPANITIKKLLSLHRPIDESLGEDAKKAGGIIGLLERLVILILLSINQFSAIGLVLTAKSIARYDEISKKKAFAEYYLLGTLLSTFIVISIYLVIL